MILFLAKRDDVHVDPVLQKCEQLGKTCFRMDPEDEWFESSIISLQSGKDSGSFEQFGRKLELSKVSAIFCRDFSFAQCKDDVEIEHHVGYSESRAALKSMFLLLDHCYWMNSPWVEEKVDNKPYQSLKAHEVGLKCPDFLITNTKNEALSFYHSSQGNVVIKQLSDICLDHSTEGKVFSFYTQKVSASDLNDLSIYPCFLQIHILKKYDLRIVYVAGKLFPYRIHSQEHEDSRVDFRVIKDLKTEPCSLPHNIEVKLITLAKSLGLEFCCIDMILDQQGEYWFLEANVQGNWLWHEEDTFPIVHRIAEVLTGA
jgi:glutathione synthase/RimK-type ligase-like ATP-grasp enzyme